MKKLTLEDIFYSFVIAMVFVMVVTTMAKSGDYAEIKAKCYSEDFADIFCKLRSTDSKVYINGKWRDDYFVYQVVNVEGENRLILWRSEYLRVKNECNR